LVKKTIRVYVSERATCFDVGCVILKLTTFLKNTHVSLSVSLRMTGLHVDREFGKC